MTINELRQKRAKLIADARALIDLADRENRDLNQEELNQYNELLKKSEQLKADVDRREALEHEERALTQPVGGALRTDPNGGASAPEVVEYRGLRFPVGQPERRGAYDHWMQVGRDNISEPERRALSAGDGTLGGFLLAPVQMATGILMAADNQTFIRQWATVIPVQGAADGLGLVSLDADPADPTWTSELGTGTEDSSMKFGKRELHPNPLAKRIKISRKLMRKVPSVEGLVTARLGYKVGVVQENTFLNGTGAKQPLGVFTASDDGVPTTRDVSTGNTQTAITFDGLKEAKYTLKGQYWARGRWIFHRDAVKMLAKIKDGEGQYVWEAAVRAGEPDRLLNFPLAMSEYCPNTFTAGKYVGVLADWSFYHVADDLNMEIQRLDELYAATNQVGFIIRAESDGMPVLGEAFVRVKLAP